MKYFTPFIIVLAASCSDGSGGGGSSPDSGNDGSLPLSNKCKAPNSVQENGECAISCEKVDEKYYCLASDEWPSDLSPEKKVTQCDHGLFSSEGCHTASVKVVPEQVDIFAGQNILATLSTNPNYFNTRTDTYGSLKYQYETYFPKFPFRAEISKDFSVNFTIKKDHFDNPYWDFSISHIDPNGNIRQPSFIPVIIDVDGVTFKTGQTDKGSFKNICQKMDEHFPEEWKFSVQDWRVGDTSFYAYDCEGQSSLDSIFAICKTVDNECSIVRVALSGKKKA